MPRKFRLEYEGAIYHVMNRGDRREAIFLGDDDRRLFLETLGEGCAKAEVASRHQAVFGTAGATGLGAVIGTH